MNLSYNQTLRRFEAQFTQDFQGDLAAVKAAKFKTDGPPTWLWHTISIGALNSLRANKPASGLTITDEARAVYTSLLPAWEAAEAQKKQLADFRKMAKKLVKQQAQEAATPQGAPVDPDQVWGGELPPCLFEGKKWTPVATVEPFVPPPHTGPYCTMCKQPVYFYELQEPFPLCLFCEKSLDKEPVS